MDARESRGVVATPWGRDRVALCAGGRRTCAANHAGRLLIRGTGGRPRPRTSVSHDENVKTAGKSRDSAVVGFHLKCTALRTPSADEHRAAFLHTLVLGLEARSRPSDRRASGRPREAPSCGGVSDRSGRFVEQSPKFFLPVPVRVVTLVENLKAECVLGELLAELLPRNLVTRLLEVGSDVALVARVHVPLEVLALALQDEHERDRNLLLPFLQNEVWINRIAAVALDREVVAADEVAVPPQHLRVFVQEQGHALLVLVQVVGHVVEQ